MPRSDFDTKAFLDEMLQAAGELSPEDRAAAERVFSVEGVKNYVADNSLRKQDYSRNSQKVLQQQKELDARNKQLNDWYEQQLLVVKQNQEEYEKMQGQIKSYENEYGKLNSGTSNAPATDPNVYIPKKQHDQELANLRQEFMQAQQAHLRFVAQATSLQGRHYHEFKEPLDEEALVESAMEMKVPIKDAYELLVAERRQKLSESHLKEQLAAAREEGRRSVLSGAKLPSANMPTELHPLEARESLGDKRSIPAWKRGLADFMDGTLEREASK
jgi:hypothetical protein